MSSEHHSMIRNAAWILVQRLGLVASGLLFAIVVPRLMGTEVYGQFALALSIAIWCTLSSELGFLSVMSRHMPEVVLRNDPDEVRKLFGNIFTVRTTVGILAAGIYFLATTRMLPDIDPGALAILSLAILLASVTDAVYCLFLGLNQAARWGMAFLGRRFLMVLLVPIGFHFGGLRGAMSGLLLLEITVFSLGTYWARPYFSRRGLRVDPGYLAPLLRLGLVFFGVSLLHHTFRYSGEVIVKIISVEYAEVAQFGAAAMMYAICEAAVLQLVHAFAPFLSLLLARQDLQQVRFWVDRLLCFMTVALGLVVLGILMLADPLIPMALGEDFRQVAMNLIPLGITLLVLVPGGMGRVLAIVLNQPGLSAAATGLRLAAYWAVGMWLIPDKGSFGACVAMLAATTIFSAHLTWRMHHAFPFPVRRWLLSLALLLPFPLLVFFKATWQRNLVLFLLAAAGYLVLVFLTHVIGLNEIRSACRILLSRPEPIQE